MKNTSSKSLKKKGGKDADADLLIFQLINNYDDENDENYKSITDTIQYLIDQNKFFEARDDNNKNQTILIRAFLKRRERVVVYILNYLEDLNKYYHEKCINYLNAIDTAGRSYYDYHTRRQNRENFSNVRRQFDFGNIGSVQDGGGYKIYNNRKYKIYTGKRGGKYICVGIEKKKVYINK